MTTKPAIAILGFLVLTSCSSPREVGQPPAPAEPRTVVVAPAARASIAKLYVATATLRGRNTATITSKTMGHVRRLYVSPGDKVEAGQSLVELDARAERARVGQTTAGIGEAEAAVAQAEQDVEAARADHDLARVTWERMRRLADKRAVTPQERDQAQAAFRAAQARVKVAEARLRAAGARTSQARASRDMARAHLGDRRVTAPFAGRVVSRSVDVGDLAAPGTPLLTLEQRGTLRAEALVDESQTGHITVGDSALITVEALERDLTGEVSEVVPAIHVGSRAFVAKVDLPADDDDVGSLRPGMFARVRFRVGTEERLVVPTSAVSRRGALERLFVADGPVARLRLVTLGAEQNGVVEVLSGLDDGEPVIVAPPPGLRDGDPIIVAPGGAP